MDYANNVTGFEQIIQMLILGFRKSSCSEGWEIDHILVESYYPTM
jgi:hypothetical protein